MNRVRILRIGGGVAAAALAGAMWMSPAWGSASRLPDTMTARAHPAAASMPGMATSDAASTLEGAAARRAAATYPTNRLVATKYRHLQLKPHMTNMRLRFLS